jgi:UDP-N-acetylglucosamine acyltransferase
MSVNIHPTAIVSNEVKLGENVSVGPYSILEGPIEIGDNCELGGHVVIKGNVTLGKNNKIFQFSSIGEAPQDLTYKGEDTKVIIGDDNVIREYVSIHRGTTKENYVTTIGNGCMFMAYVHIGHDAIVGDKCIIVNSVNIAGHVKIGERTIIGGGTNVSQFVSIGRGSYIGGASAIDRDVPLFCTAYGNRAKLKGINIIGMRRQGYAKQVVSEVVDFFRTMESSALSPRAFTEHDELMKEFVDNEIIAEMVVAIQTSEVGLAPFMS